MIAKRSIALLIRRDDDSDDVLLVQRPHDDEDLPDVWGLPAASRADGESAATAAIRAGRDKLGIDLEPGRVLNDGARDRAGYRLEMQLLAATIRGGTPAVRIPPDGTTAYQAWRWGPMSALRAAAGRGSLCSILALEWSATRP
jgi:ADP-ribose pyrophosphatase YjhB (NUDIX family)